MRFISSVGVAFALSSFLPSTSALPFAHLLRRGPIAARASYSVVPVDGSQGATTAAGGITTIISTVVESATAKPSITIVQVSVQTVEVSSPAQVVISTTTVTNDEPTASTISVTVAPPPTPVVISEAPAVTVTDTSAPIPQSSFASANSELAGSPSAVVEWSAPASSTASSSVYSTSPTYDTISWTLSSSATPTATMSAGFLGASGLDFSSPASASVATVEDSSATTTVSSEVSATIVPTTTAIPTTTSTKTYDNGQWHTTYPAWSNDTRAAKRSLAPSPIALPTDVATLDASALSNLGAALLQAANALPVPEGRKI